MLLPLTRLDGHVADTEALELESPLLSICSLQGLYGLAIPWEPLAHARLVLSPVDATDCRSYEEFHLGYLPRRKVHWQRYFFLEVLYPSSTTKFFLFLVHQK